MVMSGEEKKKMSLSEQAHDQQQPALREILEEICEFPQPTYEQWRQVTEKSLKGASFDQKLVTHTYEGINLQPMYRKEDIAGVAHVQSLPGFAPYVRGKKALQDPSRPWEINQEIDAPTPDTFNETARENLAKGQTMLHIVLDQAARSGKDADQADEKTVGNGGVSISTLTDLQQAFRDIDLARIPIFTHAGAVSLPFLALIVAYLKERGVSPERLHGCLGMDPLGVLATEGKLAYDIEMCYDVMAAVTDWSSVHCPNLQTVIVAGHPYHDGGGSAVDELAFALAAGVEYLRALQNRGTAVNEAAPKMLFSFSIGTNMFMEIAKLRAARLLWSDIVNAFGGNETAQKMNIHARSSSWTKTVYDPYVNMLRGTAEAFAAAVGGVDSMHVSPFDEPIQPSTSFSRRIARNTQLILQQEAHLSRQTDPAGGSWYVEWLTDKLAQKTWQLFQETEAKGGLLKALREGFPQTRVAQTAARRKENIQYRRDVFVGTTQYANISEKPIQQGPQTNQSRTADRHVYEERKAALQYARAGVEINKVRSLTKGLGQDVRQSSDVVDQAIEAVREGATLGDLAQALGGNEPLAVTPIPTWRGAAMFEDVRAASDAYLEKTGQRPQVFLANLGEIPEHKARADFVAGFFEVGGFEVLRNDGFDAPESAARAALKSAAEMVVICGSDQSYQRMAATLARAIKAERPSVTILLAGQPDEQEQQTYREAGIDHFIHRRSNCYDMLVRLQKEKGVTQ